MGPGVRSSALPRMGAINADGSAAAAGGVAAKASHPSALDADVGGSTVADDKTAQPAIADTNTMSSRPGMGWPPGLNLVFLVYLGSVKVLLLCCSG